MTEPRLPVVIIAAVGRNGVIGAGDRLPWRLPGDLAHFRAETWGKPVIFGRRTLAAIGKALPGRVCIALSRDPTFRMAGVSIVPDLMAALAIGESEARRMGAAEIMVAGGASVYAAALGRADELRLTRVDLQPEGDAFFPPCDPSTWREVEAIQAAPAAGDEAAYVFARYRRTYNSEPSARS